MREELNSMTVGDMPRANSRKRNSSRRLYLSRTSLVKNANGTTSTTLENLS